VAGAVGTGLAVEGAEVAGRVSDPVAAGLVRVAGATDSLLAGVFGMDLAVEGTGVAGRVSDPVTAGLVLAAGATDSLLTEAFGEGLAAGDAEAAGRVSGLDSDVTLLLFGLGRPIVTGAVAVVDSVLYLSLNEVGVIERDTVLTGLEFFESLPLLGPGRRLLLCVADPFEPLPTTLLWP
jgi:hypothetical protein